MLQSAVQPELVHEACRRYLAWSLQAVAEAAAAGCRGLWIEECLTDQLAPRTFAALNLPYLTALITAIRAAGLQSIYYYCGDPTDRWDLLLAAGADALALEETKKGFVIDLAAASRQTAGRCALLGNLDAIGVLEAGDDATLEREIARQVAVGRAHGGRFVMSVGSPVTPGTPLARVQRYLHLAHALGTG